jgi:hypothetical protein
MRMLLIKELLYVRKMLRYLLDKETIWIRRLYECQKDIIKKESDFDRAFVKANKQNKTLRKFYLRRIIYII